MEAAGKRYIVHGSRSDAFTLWNFSDLHVMNKGCAEKQIKADIQTVKDDPFAYWIGGGDYADFIGYRDKRFDPDSVSEWVSVKDLGDLGRAGMHKVAEMFDPIREKCFGLLIGNHEKKYELKTEHDTLHHWLCEQLGARSLEYCAFFDVVFHRRGKTKKPRLVGEAPPDGNSTSTSFRVFCHHGCGYAQTPGGKLNRLIQFMQRFDADIYMVGHVHDKIARREPALAANRACTDLVQRDRLGIIAGSYLKTYQLGSTLYGEMRGYAPTSLGPAVAKIVPITREMTAEV